MGYARKNLVSLQDTPYYHCVARCVRRSWLWGVDRYAGKDYSHRKQWVLDRLRLLCTMFAIEVCAYAVMSNHYHLVLYVNRRRAWEWTDEQVVDRWSVLFRTPPLVARWREGRADDAEIVAAKATIARWRTRLYDISWFMRCLNEYLARRANEEDACTGRFWEGRFKSQALLDEAGLLAAMVYVDLNPVRAGIADGPSDSDFTSVYQRFRCERDANRRARSVIPLRAFCDQAALGASAIPYLASDYLSLVEWSARAIRADQRLSLHSPPPVLALLGIEEEGWRRMIGRGTRFGRAIGRLRRMRQHAITLGQAWIRGVRRAAEIFPG
jgi:REP element-mobilizing transposase RayT